MIFKTINNSVDETRKTLALFNKDWDTYKRNWQNANGVFGKIGSIFTPANAITKSDIEAIKAYNSQIDSCVTSQTAFNRTMLNASPAAQNLVASYNGGKVSAQGMATAQNAAKASTIGLTIAQTALNAAISMGIGLLISLVVKGIDKLVHANEEAIEKAEELRRKYEEFKSTNESNVTTLKGLEKEFKELSKGVSQYGDNVSLTTEQYERYKEIIQQIVGMSPSLAEGYSTENGYIADKNGLLERAIELQEQEYRNELRKITNLDNLKTSMSGYIAEYKEAFGGGWVTDDMSATITPIATDLSEALYNAFNLNGSGKHNYDNAEKVARKIIESLGIVDVDAEIKKYINKNGYYESSWFFKAYADTIAENIEVITNSLSADDVGLDDTIFDQNIEKLDSAAQSYLDMKDAISMANESIQRDLGYIAEYADGYSDLSTEQQKFVNEFLKGFNISDIMSESNNPFDQGWKFDEDKMASIKSQITKFVEALSQDDTTQAALADLYAIPTDEQSIGEFVEQFRNALEVIHAYCKENGIEIPIAISDNEHTINDLEAQYQRAVDFAKDKFDGYDPTAFFKEHSINTQEEIDAWQKIAQGARDASEAEKEYVQSSTLNDKNPISFDISTYKDQIDNFQSQVKTLGDALSSIRSGNFEDSDLTDLLQEFPELMDKSDDLESALVELINNSLRVLYDTLGDEVPDSLKVSLQELTDIASGAAVHLSDAFSSIHDSWDILQDFKDTIASGFDANITDSLLQSVRGLSGELETLVAGYYSGVVTAEELYEALTKHYENDLSNYSEALIKKNELNEGFYNAVGLASEEVTNQFMDNYEVDLKNCTTYNQAKIEIETQTLKKVSDMWSKYYNAESRTLTADAKVLEIKAANGDAEAGKLLDEIKTQVYYYERAVDALNNITYEGIRSNFESIDGKLNINSNSSSNSSSPETTKEFSEELNWIEKLINKVSTALDKLKDKVSNTYIGWSIRNNSLSKAMEKTNDAINVQQQAYEKYMQKAASVGLSQEYVNKIQNGSLDIEDITDESLSDKIKEYETWYDKALDCSDAIEGLRTQLSDLAKQRFDNIRSYFDGLMETTEKAISRLETKEKNTFRAPSVKVYNGLYDETQNLINYNTQKVQQLEEALDSAVSSGYIEAGSEAWRDMYNEILEVRNATEEYKLELQDISKRRYDAIIKPIEQELAQLEQQKNIIEKMQDRLALQGYVEARGLYERQIRDSESRLNTLKEQATLLQQNMQDALSKGMEIGSDDWIDMKSAVDDNVISVMELENSIIELNNAIRDLEWGKFDRFQDSISRITGESDFMIGLFDKDDTYDDEGRLTDAGSAVIGLHAQNYFAYKEQAKAYKDEVDKINKELEADPANTTLIDRKNNLIDAYQNAAKAAYDEYQAVIELGKDGYQAQIDSIQELIDVKKKQLETDKSLYEYQKNIAEKTKNIADIQKQLSVLSNDDSEENKAKIQKLQVDLTDAQKDLEDTQYDKWYNAQTDMLDNLAEECAALISEQSQNEQEVFQEMIEYVNANAQGIQDTISSTAQEWDYVFSHGIDSVLAPGISGITDIGQSIYEEIRHLYELNERMYRVSADLADLGVTDYGLETTISDETTARNFIERLYNGLLDRQSDQDGLDFWMNKLMNGETVQDMLEGFLNSDEYKAMGKSASDTILDFYEGLLGRSAEIAGYQYWMDKYHNGMSLSEIGTNGFLNSEEFLSRDLWMRLLDAQPINADYTEFAKRGLIPIDSNVLLSAGLMPQISTPDYTRLPNVTSTGNTSFGDININIPIEHVTDYNDLVTQLQKDGKFEKMIQDMTIGQLAGKNSLAKNSYRWG